MKKVIIKILKIIIVLILNSSVSSGIRVLASILNGEHGKPSFVTPQFQAFALITQLLLIGAYLIFEKYMPIKSKLGQGLLFILLFWTSDYVSQILGMSGATSPIISEGALSFSTILVDSIGYLVCGITFGLLLSSSKTYDKKECGFKKLIFTSIVSMLCFSCTLFILELIMGLINPDFSCISAFFIAKEETIPFYIVFYLFQAFSGFLFPIFYRYTLYNSDRKNKWFQFASVYGLMLWAPVVLIVSFFGVELMVTIVYTIVMAIAIYIDTYVFARLMQPKA